MNASEHRKENTDFVEKPQFLNFKIKKMPFKINEFLERLLIVAFSITSTQLEKTGSTGNVFIPPEI